MNLFKYKRFYFSSIFFWTDGLQSTSAIKNNKHSNSIYKDNWVPKCFSSLLYSHSQCAKVGLMVFLSHLSVPGLREVVRFPPEHTGHCTFVAGCVLWAMWSIELVTYIFKNIVSVIFQQRENCAAYILYAKMWSLTFLRLINCKELKPKLAPTCPVLPWVEQSVAG